MFYTHPFFSLQVIKIFEYVIKDKLTWQKCEGEKKCEGVSSD